MEVPSRCFGCDAELPERTRYCPHCGVRLDSGVAEPIWPASESETTLYVRQRPRLFGVPPQDTTLVLGALAVALGVALAASGVVLAGALLLTAGALFLLVFAETYRRRPESTVVRLLVLAADVLRAESAYAWTATSTWLDARGRRLRLRWEAERLRRQRRGHLLALGRSVYEDDPEAAESARDVLREIDERIESKAAEATRLERRAAIRIRAARFGLTQRA